MANDYAWPTNSTSKAWNSTDEAQFDVDEYLQLQLGRRYRDLGESVTLIVVYCVIFLTGVVGNLCTCLVIVRNKRMHTATNYYLFSLAVSDLLTLLGKFSGVTCAQRVSVDFYVTIADACAVVYYI